MSYRSYTRFAPRSRQPAGESSISIPFTTSDLTGDFTITIEGLTQTGEALYATEQFQVK